MGRSRRPAEVTAILDKITADKICLIQERKRTSSERKDLDITRKEFEARMRGFREVCDVGWDVVMGHADIGDLKRALHSTDKLWRGFAGVSKDPGPELSEPGSVEFIQ